MVLHVHSFVRSFIYSFVRSFVLFSLYGMTHIYIYFCLFSILVDFIFVLFSFGVFFVRPREYARSLTRSLTIHCHCQCVLNRFDVRIGGTIFVFKRNWMYAKHLEWRAEAEGGRAATTRRRRGRGRGRWRWRWRRKRRGIETFFMGVVNRFLCFYTLFFLRRSAFHLACLCECVSVFKRPTNILIEYWPRACDYVLFWNWFRRTSSYMRCSVVV